MTQYSDNEIIQLVLRGYINKFELLVKKYEAPLFVFVGNLINNRQQSEDLVQDVFLSVFTNLDTFKPQESKFSTWVYRIARNKCLNALKKKREIATEWLPEAEAPQAHNPSTTMLVKESFRQLDIALESLEVQERIIFVLSELKGLSYEEISHIESLKIGTVKSKLFRAKKKIKQRLQIYMECGEALKVRQ